MSDDVLTSLSKDFPSPFKGFFSFLSVLLCCQDEKDINSLLEASPCGGKY